MPLDRFRYVDGQAVMHESVASPNTPERRGLYLVCSALTSILDDAVPSADVVECEIAEGMNYFVTQSCRYGESATVDRSSGNSSRKSTSVATGAADLIE